MPYIALADGRDYALFPRAFQDPVPLNQHGKLYTKQIAGAVQLFFQSDDGVVYQITPGSGASPNQSLAYIIWRPAVASGVGHVQTWAEVEALIATFSGNIVIAVDGNGIVPATADTECFGRVQFHFYTANIAGLSDITVADGGRLRNLFTVRTIGLHGIATIRPFLYYDVPGSLLLCREGGQISLDAGSTVPAVELDATFCELAQFEGATYNNNAPGVPFCQINPGNTALHAVIALAGTSGPPAYSAELFSGDATTVLLLIFDASGTPVPQVFFAGFVLQLPMDYAPAIVYQDGTVSPFLNQITVQGAIDALKRRVTGFGNTASRPPIPTDIDTGGMYFDTDLGIPVWSNGAIYVDSSGAPA